MDVLPFQTHGAGSNKQYYEPIPMAQRTALKIEPFKAKATSAFPTIGVFFFQRAHRCNSLCLHDLESVFLDTRNRRPCSPTEL